LNILLRSRSKLLVIAAMLTASTAARGGRVLAGDPRIEKIRKGLEVLHDQAAAARNAFSRSSRSFTTRLGRSRSRGRMTTPAVYSRDSPLARDDKLAQAEIGRDRGECPN